MVRLEALADRQTQSLTAVQRQVTKLQLRSGLMGHDVKPLLKTVSFWAAALSALLLLLLSLDPQVAVNREI